MKTILTCLVFVFSTTSAWASVEFNLYSSPDRILIGKITIEEKGQFSILLDLFNTQSNRLYAVFIHGKGVCENENFNKALTPVFVKSADTLIRRPFNSQGPDMVRIRPNVPGTYNNGKSASAASVDEYLDTNLSGHVITLQYATDSGWPTDQIIGCWIHP